MDCDLNKNSAGENAFTINALCKRVLYIAPQQKKKKKKHHVHCIIIDDCQEEESSPEQENAPLEALFIFQNNLIGFEQLQSHRCSETAISEAAGK